MTTYEWGREGPNPYGCNERDRRYFVKDEDGIVCWIPTTPEAEEMAQRIAALLNQDEAARDEMYRRSREYFALHPQTWGDRL